MPSWIAEQAVLWVHASGRRVEGRIGVGMPAIEPTGEAGCELALDGLDRPVVIYGEGTLQALLLALRLAGMRLHDFEAKGGRVLRANGDELPLDALFGPLLRAAGQPRV